MVSQESIGRSKQDLFERRGVRVAIFIVVPAVLFILVAAGIRVSQYGIDHTIIVIGERQLATDRPAALRTTLIADDGRFYLPTRITGHLVRGEQRHLLFDGPVDSGGYAFARNFHVPPLVPGPAVLELDIHFDERRRVVRAEVELVDAKPEEKLFRPPEESEASSMRVVERDGRQLEVFTEGRGAPSGFSSVFFLRQVNAELEPLSAEFQMEISSDRNKPASEQRARTDRLGLFAFTARPLGLSLPIRIRGFHLRGSRPSDAVDAGRPEDGVLYPSVIYGGLNVQVHNPLVQPHERPRLTTRQLSPGGPLYLDVFHQGQWIYAQSGWFAGTEASLEIPALPPGINRVQVTTSTLSPGRNIVVRNIYALAEGERREDALRAVFDGMDLTPRDQSWAARVSSLPLETGANLSRDLAAAFGLARLYRGHREVKELVSSRREDDAELDAFKAKFQRTVMVVIILIGLGLASMFALIARQAQKRQERITMMILADDDLPEEEQWQTDLGSQTANRRVILQGLIVFAIILGAIISIALLVDTLTWWRR